MKISLTIADRISLQTILPDKDSFENLCIRKEILDMTSFSSSEVDANKIKTVEIEGKKTITWVETQDVEYDFNQISISYIKDNLKRLSDAKELLSLHMPLYRKFYEL